MSLGGMFSGAIDIHALVDQLKHSGGNVIVINPGSAAGSPMPPMMDEPEGAEMISNGAPPALGPDIEDPVEDAAEGGKEEPQDMMGAVKAGLNKKSGPPKPPSKGAGKGPAKPQTKPGSAKLPAKKGPPPAIKKAKGK